MERSAPPEDQQETPEQARKICIEIAGMSLESTQAFILLQIAPIFLANILIECFEAIAQNLNQAYQNTRSAQEKYTSEYRQFIAKMQSFLIEAAAIAYSLEELLEERQDSNKNYPQHLAPFQFNSDYHKRENFSDHLHAAVSQFLKIANALERILSSPGKQTPSPSNKRTPLDEIASNCATALCLCGGYIHIYDQFFRCSLKKVPGISIDADPNTGCRVRFDKQLFAPQTHEAQEETLSQEIFLPNIVVMQQDIQRAYNELVGNFHCVINEMPLIPMHSTEEMANVFLLNVRDFNTFSEKTRQAEEEFAQACEAINAARGLGPFPPHTGNA